MNEQHASRSQEAVAQGAEWRKRDELLSWENLGAQPAGRAFRESMVELLIRPGRFFRKMAVSGGLHEPLTFFAVVLGAGVLLAFPAALAYFGLAAPDPARAGAQEYAAYTFPARLTGLLAVLLPLVLLAGGVIMVVLGTLFHVPGKLFGSRNWEGSVSIWLYSASAALAPLVLALGALFLVSLSGYLLGIAWPGTRGPAAAVAGWTSVVLFLVAFVAALGLMLINTTVGCTRAFDLDGTRGTAAGLSGLLFVAAIVSVCGWSFARRGATAGLIVAGICALAATALTVVSVARSRSSQGGA